MQYLLDTNIISDFMHNPRGKVVQRIRQLGVHAICTSVIVAAELRYGVFKRGSERLQFRLDQTLQSLTVLAFDAPGDLIYGELRAGLEARGQTIGNNDMLIAAHALTLGCVLVTANEREFARISGLRYENWVS